MKEFNEFINYLNDNLDSILYDIKNGLNDVSESQRTISREEWEFIHKTIIKSNIAILRQYHTWLHKEPQK